MPDDGAKSEMELGDFIKNALVQIAAGVRGANDEVKSRNGQSHHYFTLMRNKGDAGKHASPIRFDVGVTISGERTGGAHLAVPALAVVGINVGAGGQVRSGDVSVHRIQFDVGLDGDLS